MNIELTDDQALVLSDWLNRVMEGKEFAALVDDRAVWSPLLKISGTLDKQVAVIFHPNYSDYLAAARERLIAEIGDIGR